MKMRSQARKPLSRRRGAATVEFAMICIPLFMFLFGVFEYGRYVLALQTFENAAREGARFAVVNTFSATVAADSITEVRKRMANVDQTVFGMPATVTVYAADITGANIGPPQNAAFGAFIGVRIQGQFKPVLPTLIITRTINMDIKALMNSEAN